MKADLPLFNRDSKLGGIPGRLRFRYGFRHRSWSPRSSRTPVRTNRPISPCGPRLSAGAIRLILPLTSGLRP
jgi:hypothetical protein